MICSIVMRTDLDRERQEVNVIQHNHISECFMDSGTYSRGVAVAPLISITSQTATSSTQRVQTTMPTTVKCNRSCTCITFTSTNGTSGLYLGGSMYGTMRNGRARCRTRDSLCQGPSLVPRSTLSSLTRKDVELVISSAGVLTTSFILWLTSRGCIFSRHFLEALFSDSARVVLASNITSKCFGLGDISFCQVLTLGLELTL